MCMKPSLTPHQLNITKWLLLLTDRMKELPSQTLPTSLAHKIMESNKIVVLSHSFGLSLLCSKTHLEPKGTMEWRKGNHVWKKSEKEHTPDKFQNVWFTHMYAHTHTPGTIHLPQYNLITQPLKWELKPSEDQKLSWQGHETLRWKGSWVRKDWN